MIRQPRDNLNTVFHRRNRSTVICSAPSLSAKAVKRRKTRSQLTMPLLAAYTPPGVELQHTDEIVEPVDLDRDADLVAITCNTPARAFDRPRCIKTYRLFQRTSRRLRTPWDHWLQHRSESGFRG